MSEDKKKVIIDKFEVDYMINNGEKECRLFYDRQFLLSAKEGCGVYKLIHDLLAVKQPAHEDKTMTENRPSKYEMINGMTVPQIIQLQSWFEKQSGKTFVNFWEEAFNAGRDSVITEIKTPGAK